MASILNEEGIQFDRLKIWPKSGKSDSSEGVNGFVSMTRTQKDIDEEVLGVRIRLKKGTPIIVKFLGQRKYWQNSVLDGEDAFNVSGARKEKNLEDFRATFDKKTFDKEIKKMLQSVKEADKEEEEEDLENYYGDEKGLTKLLYISKYVSKDLLSEATLQQEAAVAGLAPFVYGYDEDPPNYALTMQIIPTAVDAEGMNKAYRRGPMSHRMQLAALAHELDQLKIHHNDFKPDNYRLDGDRLYLIDFGKAQRFDFSSSYDKPTNVAALNMGGYSIFARPSNTRNAFLTLETEISRRDDIGDVELYDHEKATQRKYRKGNKVLVDLEIPIVGKKRFVQYMLYECTGRNSSQQNNILPPFVIRERGEYKIGSPNSSYCHVEGNYYDYLDKGILNRKIKRDTNANDRPSWKALWVHSTIPYTMEECLAERERILKGGKIIQMKPASGPKLKL